MICFEISNAHKYFDGFEDYFCERHPNQIFCFSCFFPDIYGLRISRVPTGFEQQDDNHARLLRRPDNERVLESVIFELVGTLIHYVDGKNT